MSKYFDLEKAYEAMFHEFYHSVEARNARTKYEYANEKMKQVIEVVQNKMWRKYP